MGRSIQNSSLLMQFDPVLIFKPSPLQAWTNMVLTVLNQVHLLPDSSFLALLPALYPCLSQLSCHVTDPRVRHALHEWLGRVGRLYDITG